MPQSCCGSSGTLLGVQVTPPSVVPNMVTASCGDAPSVARHVVVEVQVTSCKGPVPEGKVWVVQIDPPSVVARIVPTPADLGALPTTKHVEVEGHAIPCSIIDAVGSLSFD